MHIEKNVQPSLVGALTSNNDADMVLELNAGKAEKLGINVGEWVVF